MTADSFFWLAIGAAGAMLVIAFCGLMGGD